MSLNIRITEAPRDAMQGMKEFIPTRQKADLLNAFLKVGFDILDFGSFVSPNAIPQLKDTAEVISLLDVSQTKTALMAIVGNVKGGIRAAGFPEIGYIGFPFSFSETFLKRNLNSTIEQARKTVDELHNICLKNNKKLLTYISMAFGNPYGDTWSIELILQWARYFENMGIEIIALSDIIGIADDGLIGDVFKALQPEITKPEVALHLHTQPHNWYKKVDAAYKNGCRRFDGVTGGLGGCPMTGYELLGNLDTQNLIGFCDENKIEHGLNLQEYEKAKNLALQTYPVNS